MRLAEVKKVCVDRMRLAGVKKVCVDRMRLPAVIRGVRTVEFFPHPDPPDLLTHGPDLENRQNRRFGSI